VNRTLALVLLAVSIVANSCGVTVRVMTYNIHHGVGIDKRLDLERIAAVIRDADVDIVALNEVDKGTSRTERRDLAAELAKLCGMTAVFERNIDFKGGEYGNAVLTRFPVSWHRNHHYEMVRPGEQRGLLQVGLEVSGRELSFLVTHIDHRRDDVERVSNVAEILAIVGESGKKLIILCGDFNDTPGSRTHTGLVRRFVDCWAVVGPDVGYTYPSPAPRRRIDYVFVPKGSGITPLSATIPETLASDHLPLVVELELR
jgi:endonuclease/exonuclease/phosphatase family metal-dependent hydrolase